MAKFGLNDIPAFNLHTVEECTRLGHTRLDAFWADLERDITCCVARLSGGLCPQFNQRDGECVAVMSPKFYVEMVVLALLFFSLWYCPGRLQANGRTTKEKRQ